MARKTPPGDIRHMNAPVTLTRDEAFHRWCLLPEKQRTYRGFERAMRAEGHKISRAIIARWSRKDPRWAAMASDIEVTKASVIAQLLNTLTVEGRAIHPAVYTGLQARIIARLAEAIPKVKLETPTDVTDMLTSADRVRGLVHDARGDSKTAGGNPETAGAVARAAADATGAPVVSLGSFKRPNGANGHG